LQYLNLAKLQYVLIFFKNINANFPNLRYLKFAICYLSWYYINFYFLSNTDKQSNEIHLVLNIKVLKRLINKPLVYLLVPDSVLVRCASSRRMKSRAQSVARPRLLLRPSSAWGDLRRPAAYHPRDSNQSRTTRRPACSLFGLWVALKSCIRDQLWSGNKYN